MQNILKKLHKISGIKVDKDKTNPHFGNKYASLDNIVNVLNPILQANNLVVTHSIENSVLITTVHDIESEDKISSQFPINVTEPQKVGSALTYGKRYSLSALFNIVADDEDDDGNLAQSQKVPAQKPSNSYGF